MKQVKLLSIYLIFFFLASFTNLYGQCNCVDKSANGIKLTQCTPDMVANNSFSQLGLSITKINGAKSVMPTIRFQGQAKLMQGSVTLSLKNGELLVIAVAKTDKAFLGGSYMTHGMLNLTDNQERKLLKSSLQAVTIELEDGVKYTYKVSRKADILSEQLNCVK